VPPKRTVARVTIIVLMMTIPTNDHCLSTNPTVATRRKVTLSMCRTTLAEAKPPQTMTTNMPMIQLKSSPQRSYLVVDESTVFELGRFQALQNLAQFSNVVFRSMRLFVDLDHHTRIHKNKRR